MSLLVEAIELGEKSGIRDEVLQIWRRLSKNGDLMKRDRSLKEEAKSTTPAYQP